MKKQEVIAMLQDKTCESCSIEEIQMMRFPGDSPGVSSTGSCFIKHSQSFISSTCKWWVRKNGQADN